MDIPVSRLNERMAVQVPSELPLGLVFVVGKVEDLALIDEDGHPHEFVLLESGHHLRCRLTDRAAHEVGFKDGDLVRAGGHLAFEPQHAGYFLLARDVEILEEFTPSRSTLSEIVAESKQQTQIVGLAAAELPTWVKQMAPPEIQEELLASAALSGEESESQPGDSWEALEDTEASMAYPTEEPALAGLSDDLIEFLSEAMDGPEDIEVTSQLISTYGQPNKSGATTGDVVRVVGPVADEIVASDEAGAKELAPVAPAEDTSDGDGGPAEEALDEVVEQAKDKDANGTATARPAAEPKAEAVAAGSVAEEAEAADQLPVEAGRTSSTGSAARRKRRDEQRDKVPWLLVVVAVFLFLLFLAVMVIGLFFV
jgi:hypothetical protein